MGPMNPGAASRRTFVAIALVIASVLLVAGLFIGLTEVGGHYDSESFDCGSPFIAATDDGGYGGSEQYEACDQERGHMRVVALGSLGLGLALLAASTSSMTAHRRVAHPGVSVS